MKFKYIKNIQADRIYQFTVFDKNLLYLSADESVQNKKWYLNNELIRDYELATLFEDNLLLLRKNHESPHTILKNIATKEIYTINNFHAHRIIDSGKYLIGKELNDNAFENYKVFDLKNQEVKYKVPYFINFLGETQNYFFLKSGHNYPKEFHKNILVAINKNTGTVQWKLYIRDIPKITKPEHNEIFAYIGVHENNVLIHVMNGGIVAVDIVTGKIKWQINSISENRTNRKDSDWYFHTPDRVHALSFHLYGDKIYYFFRSYFGEIDLKTQRAIISFDLLDSVTDAVESMPLLQHYYRQRNGVFPIGNNVLVKDHIISVADDGTTLGGEYIISLNINDFQIDWLHKANSGNFYGSSGLKYSNQSLYTLDLEGKLHVFQEVQNEAQ